MLDWFFDFSDISSFMLRLMFFLWLYMLLFRKKKQPTEPPEDEPREEQPGPQEAPSQPTTIQPDPDDAKLASKGTQYGKDKMYRDDDKLASKGTMYRDGDKPVHTDNETLQHDKGYRYRDGDKPVHTDAEQPGRDEGHRYRDGDKPVHTDNETIQHDKGKVFVDRAKPEPVLIDAKPEASYFTEPEQAQPVTGKWKPAKKKLVRPALAQQFIMSQVLAKPKGLE